MKKYFLLLKQHKVTGKKYLCYHKGTVESCYIYPGSGTYWKRHIKVHGKKINTIILLETDNKDDIREKGIEYSKLWNVVGSDEFANLVNEDGSGGHEAMSTSRVIKRRANTLKKRIDQHGFTEAELNRHNSTKQRQQGKTMAERLNKPGYIDPRKGKTAKDIYGDGFIQWNKGIRMKDRYGSDWVDPKSRPFKITSHMGEKVYNSESEFIAQENFSAPTLTKLKQTGWYKVKRQKNTKHFYKSGETIYLEFI
jgi:hypothetical protein